MSSNPEENERGQASEEDRGRSVIWAPVGQNRQEELTRLFRRERSGFGGMVVHSKLLFYGFADDAARANADAHSALLAAVHFGLVNSLFDAYTGERPRLRTNSNFANVTIQLVSPGDSRLTCVVFGRPIEVEEEEFDRVLDEVIGVANEILTPLTGGLNLIPPVPSTASGDMYSVIPPGRTGLEPMIGGEQK